MRGLKLKTLSHCVGTLARQSGWAIHYWGAWRTNSFSERTCFTTAGEAALPVLHLVRPTYSVLGEWQVEWVPLGLSSFPSFFPVKVKL